MDRYSCGCKDWFGERQGTWGDGWERWAGRGQEEWSEGRWEAASERMVRTQRELSRLLLSIACCLLWYSGVLLLVPAAS